MTRRAHYTSPDPDQHGNPMETQFDLRRRLVLDCDVEELR
jgi:hypothetical protein